MRKVITIKIDYDEECHVPSQREIDAKLNELVERHNLLTPTGEEIVDEYSWDVEEVK